MRAEARRVLDLFSVHIDPDTPVSDLDVASQQMVEIAKAISMNAKVVVMDEPTAALNEQECQILFDTVDRIRAHGTAIIYITHRMREVTRLADRVTVLKDGEVAAQFDRNPAPETVVRAMVGRDIADFYAPPATPDEIGDVVLSVRGLGNARLRDITFDLRAGEITGFAGIQGAGRVALAMALYGAAPVTSGTIALEGREVRFGSPRAGIGLLPGDRKAEALLLMQSVRDNGMLTARAFDHLWSGQNATAYADLSTMDRLLDRMDVRATSYAQEIRYLSGGNQQKAIVARWVALEPKLLIFIEPSRGIDVNAKAGIYHLMRDLARAGAAIMMISSDLPEVIGAADRILVMRAGEISAEFPRGATEQEIMLAATLEGEEAA
jgi:ribose transport system ATP-binding protein